jgi:hypothetical protein
MRDENEQKRADYQQHLEQVQAKLDEVERTFAAAGQPPAAKGPREPAGGNTVE